MGVPTVRRAKAARQQCPVPASYGSEGLVAAAYPALRAAVLAAREYRRARGVKGRELAKPTTPTFPRPNPATPLVWLPHLPIFFQGRAWCVRCFLRNKKLLATPCPGARPPTSALLQQLQSGGLDHALASSPQAQQARAAVLGWRRGPAPMQDDHVPMTLPPLQPLYGVPPMCQACLLR